MDQINPGLKTGSRILNYQIQQIVELPEINAFYYELEHTPTGAKHIHISKNDEENTFSVAFKTVPTDSTGVAHILEHTVLCGSKQYPVRDPFFSMIKRSLNTFMNAFTASDWTMYPFTTQNKKDYYNLMGVYLDSTFFPKLDRLSFKQEGHRLEFEGDNQLTYKGVVYNEMKGAMSSPDQIMGRSILNALYPDTTYSFNSGGAPEQIPNLTYEQLNAFHKHHYHPSNSFFYTYGNLALEPQLKFIEENVLNKFSRIHPDTDVPSQPRWDTPKTATYAYPFDENDDPTKKHQVCLAWLTADIRDTFEILTLIILEQVLIGNSGSPLRKALIDSELGSTLSDGTGYDGENKDTMFTCGLKDVALASVDEIEKIIFDTLADLVNNGIDKKLVDSAIHQIEFHRKEVTNTPYPYGIKLLLRFSGEWFHGGDPSTILKFDALMDRLFKELDNGPFLENQIKKYFLNNPHRVRLLLKPDPAMADNEKKRVHKELSQIRKNLLPSDIETIDSDTRALSTLQDTKENLSCLPTLEIEDIDTGIQTADESPGYDNIAAACYEQPTSGIFYITTAIGLQSLPAELLALVPFFCNALILSGTKRHSYTEIAQLIDLYTGGLGLTINAGTRFGETDEDSCLPVMTFSAKCLSRNQQKMFELIDELLCDSDFSDLNRLKQLLLEYRSNMESAVVSNGHRFAVSLASRNFSAANALNEQWHGIHQLKNLKEITDDLNDSRLKSISHDLLRISTTLLKKNNMKFALIGEQSNLNHVKNFMDALKKNLGKGENTGFKSPDIDFSSDPGREGWSTASAVSFVVKVFETNRLTHKDAPALAVISKLLRSMFLHREIREKGGAYGGFAVYQPENGLFYFGSYRDPHIVNTLTVYNAAADFITTGDYTDEDIKEAILQVCAEIDRPDTPNAAAGKDFYRKLAGLTNDMRKTFKQGVLGLNREKVLSVAQTYFGPNRSPSSVAVISSEDALKEANTKLKENPLALHRI